MRLQKLDIKGFKSFGDKITIHFNEGITAIAGPNGCGKSNVVDAIRWVLGEQSTKMLRSEKMENIIFNGTKNRKPSNLAEVSLTFDNTKNILPTSFSEVTITRKLYRTGESEYRLNDVQCRLKDITDLFLDTGIGADSYAIIELKMIDEIIANKDGSRRVLFEEASGISKYKLRKKQTFSKLKETEADLSRVDDLLFEIEKNLKTLENQAKKAEKYYQLKEQYKQQSILLASVKITGFAKAIELLNSKESSLLNEKTQIIAQLGSVEANLQQLKNEQLTAEKNLSFQQKTTNDFLNKIRAYENEKKIKNEQLKYLKDKENRLSEDLNKDKNQLNHILYNIKRLEEDEHNEAITLSIIEKQVADFKAEADELRKLLEAEKKLLDGAAKENNRVQNEFYSVQKELEILQIQKETLLQESNRNTEDTAAKELELTAFQTNTEKLNTQIQLKKDELDALTRDELQRDEKIKETELSIQSHREDINQANRALDAAQNEYNLTKSMVDNLEGFPESIRFLKKNAGWSKNAPLLSDIFFCKEEYRIAIENYLEPVMNHYVVENEKEAINAIKLLSNSSRGRANFFLLDQVVNEQITARINDKDDVIPALSVIETDEKYNSLCKKLLNGVFLIDDFNHEQIEVDVKNSGIILLAKSGKFSKSKFTMSGGSVGLFEGKRIGRAKNLENLSKEISKKQAYLSIAKDEIAQLNDLIKKLQSESKKAIITQLQNQANSLQNELITVKTRQEQFEAFINSSNNRKRDISEKIVLIENNINLKKPLKAQLEEQKQELTTSYSKKQEDYQQLTDELSIKSNHYNAENIRFHQQQNKLASVKKDLEYRYSQRKNLSEKIEVHSNSLKETQLEIAVLVSQHENHDDDLLTMYGNKEEMEKAVQEAEQHYYAARGEITALEDSINILRKNKDRHDELLSIQKDERNNIQIELNAIKERLLVEFSLNADDLSTENLPEDEDKTKELAAKFKKQLDDYGAINPMALEAFKEMKERFTFINEQKNDLLKAKASLLQTIKEIDDTAKEKFMNAFVAVRENFMMVFRSLFNDEDSCDLILTEPNDPLASDIDIIARPKGKRPLSINQLSGGEKTLTATALLFSLYLLKPAPFCIFDEVDAPLDDTNIDKFNTIIRKFSTDSQFIIVSHNKRTIASTDIIYGVTMVEQGVSRVVAVDIREVAA